MGMSFFSWRNARCRRRSRGSISRSLLLLEAEEMACTTMSEEHQISQILHSHSSVGHRLRQVGHRVVDIQVSRRILHKIDSATTTSVLQLVFRDGVLLSKANLK